MAGFERGDPRGPGRAGTAKSITPETAAEIAAATGTPASTWLKLQAAHQLRLLATPEAESRLSDVQRRARLRSMLPMSELETRGIIPEGPLNLQEDAVKTLLGLQSFADQPRFLAAARRNNPSDDPTRAQIAWLACAELAAASSPRPRRVADWHRSAEELGSELSRRLVDPDAVPNLHEAFGDSGIRLVFVPAFRGSRIDGAAFVRDDIPVVAWSGRNKAFDSLMFTLLHELAHLARGHADGHLRWDDDLAHGGRSNDERQADADAAHWAVKPLRLDPPISRRQVIAEARAQEVHPGLVVGRLHSQGKLPWSHLNALIPRVETESLLCPTTPGWSRTGHAIRT